MTDGDGVDLSKYEARRVDRDRFTVVPATCEEAAREQAASLWDCEPRNVEVTNVDE